MASRRRVGLAQVDCALGEPEENVERHLRWIERAAAEGVELLVFPELSLTGYRLLDRAARVAVRLGDSPLVRRLAGAAGDMAIVVGLVEEDGGALHNTALLLRGGEVALLYRKIQLPTYGPFEEGRSFAPGRRLELASVDGAFLGLLLCEDLWHPQLARRLCRAGADVLAVPSAGPEGAGPGSVPASPEDWETLTRATALVNGVWVLYCNRVGREGRITFPGGSHVVRPDGTLAARAPRGDEALLVAEIDLAEAARRRRLRPLVAAERHDVEGPS